ncbi:PKD domain-containing protein [Natronococcus wangiae]|uniref:PKD domain-containing protein n=1 Tax=Natronococcus wangiae TaxID=3068275 RepID=UPI00273EA3EC|nr:PKD domain-containing protein [Natronococcus sp. AD5]
MTTSHRQSVRLGALVLLIVVGLTVGMGPAMALGDTTSPATQASASAAVEDDLKDAKVPTAVKPGESFTVDATEIAERDEVADVCWRFDENETCHDAETTHTFEEAGSHTATLIVTDDDGEQSSMTNLVIATTTPTADLSAPDSAEAETKIKLDASDSTDDHSIESYEWDLTGDGTADETTSEPELSHTFESAGTHEVSVTTVNAAGQSDTASATIDVTKEQSSATFVDGLIESSAIIGILLAIGAVAIGTFLFTRTEG